MMNIEVELEIPEGGARLALIRIDADGEAHIWGYVEEDMLLNPEALAEHLSGLFGRFDPETGELIRRRD